MKIVAIIPARGGSKGIPKKNLIPICGKPLIAWSIIQASEAQMIDDIYISSDDEEILHVGTDYGARPIKRPAEIAGDDATSESAWLHAIDSIESAGTKLDLVVGMQATSPIRHSKDLDNAIHQFIPSRYKSLMAGNEIEDFHIWRKDRDGNAKSVNYDYRNRKRRQNIEKKYLENGSFYIFQPNLLKSHNNRLVADIDIYIMEKYKMFQIDEQQDISLCEALMRHFHISEA
jgi:CMP-N,N'-diacetyllegionaminic acid synthase